MKNGSEAAFLVSSVGLLLFLFSIVSLQNPHVSYEGEITVDDTEYNFTERLSPLGRAYFGENRVDIQTNRPIKKVLVTCNHEKIHLLFPDYRHPDPLPENLSEDPVYRLEDHTRLPVCRNAVLKAYHRQTNEPFFFINLFRTRS